MKFCAHLLLILSTTIVANFSHAQEANTPLLIEESSKVLGAGSAVDLTPIALQTLYHEAIKSNFGVILAKHKGKTIILNQIYVVFSNDLGVPTQVKRKVILNQSEYFGEDKDTECAVKIIQEGSFEINGKWLSGLTHHIELPNCPNEIPQNKQLPLSKYSKSKVNTDIPLQSIPVVSTIYTNTDTKTSPTPTPTPTPIPMQATPVPTSSLVVPTATPEPVSTATPSPIENINLTEYVFGRVNEEKVAFIIDTSQSFSKFQEKVIASVSKTISEFNENQKFTIVFLAPKNIYFNDGIVINATDSAKRKALKFLKHVPAENVNEPITAAIKTISNQNGKIDRIYFFGDGDRDPEGNLDEIEDQLKNHPEKSRNDLLDLLQAVNDYGVPITARSGYPKGFKGSGKLNNDLIILSTIVANSHGINIEEEL